MTKRRDSKPADPKMFVRVPHQAGVHALALLRGTYGPHAPAPITALMTALEEGIEHHTRFRAARGQSRFAPLLTAPSVTFDTPTPLVAARIKANAHQWAKYHGHQIATRSHPQKTQTTVYMVQRARG